jgi:hypothetical protein
VGQCKGICVLVAKIPVCEEEEEEEEGRTESMDA